MTTLGPSVSHTLILQLAVFAPKSEMVQCSLLAHLSLSKIFDRATIRTAIGRPLPLADQIPLMIPMRPKEPLEVSVM